MLLVSQAGELKGLSGTFPSILGSYYLAWRPSICTIKHPSCWIARSCATGQFRLENEKGTACPIEMTGTNPTVSGRQSPLESDKPALCSKGQGNASFDSIGCAQLGTQGELPFAALGY